LNTDKRPGAEPVTRPTKSLEQHCIELMEEKIARLEAEISSLKENERDSKSQVSTVLLNHSSLYY